MNWLDVHRAIYLVAGGCSPPSGAMLQTAVIRPDTHWLTPLKIPLLPDAALTHPRACVRTTWPVYACGYSKRSVVGRLAYAHRFALEGVIVSIPPGYEVSHLCGNRVCVNPAHLALASPWQNTSDKVGDGTRQAGERSGTAKLSDAEVVDIRVRRARGDSCTSIARDYGISPETVSKIALGYIRADAGGPISKSRGNGRKPTINRDALRELVGRMPTSAISKQLGCSQQGVAELAVRLKLDVRPRAWFVDRHDSLGGLSIADFLRAHLI